MYIVLNLKMLLSQQNLSRIKYKNYRIYMISDNIKVVGQLRVVHTDQFGKLIGDYVHPNMVVTLGKNFMASRMKDATSPVMSHMGLGSGVTATATSDTALNNALGGRVALTSTTVVANTITYMATFGPGVSTGSVTEAGIFSSASVGNNMLNRTVFVAVPKAAGDSIIVTWSVTIQ
jgi:hypothetical protein